MEKPVRYLVPHYSCWKNYTCCPWAKSVIALDPETERPILCPVTCKRWGCPYCAVRKIRKLAYLTNAAAPNRWIRLGVDPALYEAQEATADNNWEKKSAPQVAWEKTAPQFPECFRILRKLRDEPIEYLRVTELHKSGFPHYHALLRCGFLPKKQLDDTWAKLTGAPYNWIAKIDSTFSSFRYLVKYLTKLHKIEWTDRHVSYSRGFFPEEAKEKLAFPERTIIERSDEHPWVYLSRRHCTETVGVDDNGCYHLDDIFCGTPVDLNRDDVGLPRLPEKTEPTPPPRVQAAMFDDHADRSYYTEGF
jgi:hypothetical protein